MPGAGGSPPVPAGVLAAVAPHLQRARVIAAPTAAVAAVLRRVVGAELVAGPLRGLADGAADAVALLDDELSRGVGGTHADRADEDPEMLVAEAARVLRPGGLLLATARNRVHAAAAGVDLGGVRAYDAAELTRAFGHRGFRLELLCAPGAAAALRAAGAGDYHPELDRRPGLLDAGARLVAVGRRAPDERARSAAFFATLPRKVIAAAVLCRDPDGRVLIVHDSFKRHWTVPGGVVDADEDPRSAAAREAWEEAGVRVEVGKLLGVFAGTWPDRLMFVYDATPASPDRSPRPRHPHEIDAAEWADLDDALARVAPHIAAQLRRGLRSPGRTWPAADDYREPGAAG